MNELIEVTLDYMADGDVVTYTRSITREQLGDLIVRFDEMADESEQG